MSSDNQHFAALLFHFFQNGCPPTRLGETTTSKRLLLESIECSLLWFVKPHTCLSENRVKIWKFYKIVMFSLKCSIWGYTGIPHHWTNPPEWISLTTPSQTILTSCNVFRSDFPQAHAVLKISRTVKENKHLSWWSTTAAFWDNTLIQELIMQ